MNMEFSFIVLCCTLVSHVYGQDLLSGLDELRKPYINEFFMKLTDENKLSDVTDKAETINLHLLKKILTRLYLFKKTNLPDLSETPVSEQELLSWMKLLGNSVEYIRQDKYEQVYNYRDTKYTEPEIDDIENMLLEDFVEDLPDTEDVTEPESLEVTETATEKSTDPDHMEDLERERIKIAVLDAAFDTDHHNLKNNIMKDLAYNFVDHNGNTKPDIQSLKDPFLYNILSHGTKCMGRIASVEEHGCSLGGDISASIIPLRFLTDDGLKRGTSEIDSLKYKTDEIDIYSCSYGQRDNIGFSTQNVDVEDAIFQGVSQGRSCKGCIYLFPSGNGNGYGDTDNCNADMYASSVNTITISSISMSGKIGKGVETCPCTLVATYGSPDPQAKLFMNTTVPNNKCTSDFSGTSAATAYAAAMISHALKVNKNLSKRDIEHLLVQTANQNLHPSVRWHKNGANLRFNDKIGFGAIDLDALKAAAKTWQYVPEKHICEAEKGNLGHFMNGTSYTLEYNINVTACYGTQNSVKFLEHTQIELELTCNNISAISINLISPRLTKVGILTKITTSRVAYTGLLWKFMTVHFWEEDPTGIWRLELVANSEKPVESSVRIKKLILHGTETHPSSGGKQVTCGRKQMTFENDEGLSSATIIGICIGLTVLVSIVILIICCCRYYKKNNNKFSCKYSPVNVGET